MEYLKSIQQIKDEVAEDERQIQALLFGEEIIDTPLDVYELCPICKKNRLYRSYWTCKGCGNNLPVEQHTRYLIENFK